ncbi:MAG: hypothetical protein JZU63_06390, partial [Rhodoferax sp.]|nr:hypothetical protein [Rhodoferax sp.]
MARWQISAAGDLLASINNAYDIGGSVSGVNRPKNLFLSGFIEVGNADGRITFDGGSKVFSTASNTCIVDRYRRVGSGTPEGAVTAPIGAVYHRTDGGASTTLYVK